MRTGMFIIHQFHTLKLLRDYSKHFIGIIETFERKAVNKAGIGPDQTNPWNLHVPILLKKGWG